MKISKYRRLYSITQEPMCCHGCKIILTIAGATDLNEPDTAGNAICPLCKKPLENAIV